MNIFLLTKTEGKRQLAVSSKRPKRTLFLGVGNGVINTQRRVLLEASSSNKALDILTRKKCPMISSRQTKRIKNYSLNFQQIQFLDILKISQMYEIRIMIEIHFLWIEHKRKRLVQCTFCQNICILRFVTNISWFMDAQQSIDKATFTDHREFPDNNWQNNLWVDDERRLKFRLVIFTFDGLTTLSFHYL